MPLVRLTTVQQASLNALERWLLEQDEIVDRDIFVRAQWPEPDQPLPTGQSITLLLAGQPDDLFTQEQLVAVKPVQGSDVTIDTVWRMKVRRQPIQVDLWSNFATERDELEAIWDILSHRGIGYTIPGTFGDPVRDGLLLKLDPDADGHEGYADFTFDPPQRADTANARQQREFRSTINGTLEVVLCVTARTAKIARIIVEQTVNGQPFPDTVITEASAS